MKAKIRLLVSIGLILLLTVGSLVGCGEGASSDNGANASGTNAEDGNPQIGDLLTISVATFEGDELLDYPMVQAAQEKFNIRFEIETIPWDGWTERVNTMVAGNNLPDMLAWYDMNYGTYINWSQRGVFKEIPSLDPYPNISNIYEPIDDLMKNFEVGGKIYAMPKTINRNPINDIDNMFYTYRRDWAVAMGYDYDRVQTVTFDEFMQFLIDVKENDPGQLGDKLIPLDSGGGWEDIWGIAMLWNPYIMRYVQIDGEYKWGAALPESIDMLKGFQEMYNAGLLAKDFYTYSLGEGEKRFLEGRTAVLNQFPGIYNMQDNIMKLKQIVSGFTSDDYGVLLVESPDGRVKIYEKMQYWAGYAYSADIDDAKLERMMMLNDWVLSDEGVEFMAYGVYGEDWERDGDEIILHWPKNEEGEYDLNRENGKNYIRDEFDFFKWFRLEGDDVWLPGNPFYEQDVKDLYIRAKEELEPITDVIPTDWKAEFLQTPNKMKYGAFEDEIKNEMAKIIVSSTNIEDDWNSWIESMSSKVNAVLEELNNME